MFERREALLAVEEAELGVKDARVSAKRAADDLEEAERKGISRSDTVRDAQEALADAQHSVAEATQAVANAQREQQRALAGTSSAMQNLHDSMSDLSPVQQDFARFLYSLKPRLDEVRATAAKGLLPGVQAGIEAAMKNFGRLRTVLRATSRVMGQAAERAGEFVGRKGFGRDLEEIGKTNARALRSMSNAGLNLADAFRHVMVAAGPLTDWFGRQTVKFTEFIKQSAKAGREAVTSPSSSRRPRTSCGCSARCSEISARAFGT